MARFRLEKWYLDVADDNGSAFIGYAAKLKWKLINLSYSGFTFLNTKGKVQQRNSFSQSDFPVSLNDQITWNKKLCSGSWTKLSDSILETLLSTPDGDIIWHCYFPKAQATVNIGEAKVRGLGYAEFIELTILPWKLPIHQLHWGRFLSNDHVVVWIRWIGPVPKTIVFHNGVRKTDVEISQQQLLFHGFILKLREPIAMRRGTLMNTVFSRFPTLAKLFPKAVLQLRENKWCSTGELYHDDKKIASGKAIHEVVEWQ